jgi:eukaryotic-like serine/threonine-protein kinase
VETLSVVIPRRDPLTGTGFRARRRLGGGASSEIFEAEGPNGRVCAVKVLRTMHLDTRDAVRRLALEGQALAALSHPNLVPVLDAGVTLDGRPWFAMPKLLGETLRDRLDRVGSIPSTEACSLFLGLLAGLDAAHAAGIVHRDLKPANLFLVPCPRRLGGAGERERVVILDFGIAKIAGSAIEPSSGAYVLGTPRYLAPEQVLGGAVDARTDVYAAGLVLYEMLTGKSPFACRGMIELMRAQLEEKPGRVRARVRVGHELDHAVARAVEKSPARRWASAAVFSAVIERAATIERTRTATPERATAVMS